MNDFPFLVFPTHVPVPRNKLTGGEGKQPSCPDVHSNYNRLSPKFEALQNLLDSKAAIVQAGVEAHSPDEVLVLETVSRVDRFLNAVRLIEGLEWLAEVDVDIEPDEDFYHLDDEGRPNGQPLSGRLYLISTNNLALREFVSLYNRYAANPEAPLPYRYGKFKDVFMLLKDVRFWNHNDRLGWGDVDNWLRGIELFPEQLTRFQIELWFRNDANARNNAQTDVSSVLSAQGGRVISSCQIPEIQYHAILAEAPSASMRDILTNIEEGTLIQCNGVMFVRPSGQMVALETVIENIDFVAVEDEDPLPNGSPVVALFDGYPMENHSILSNRLQIDDPDNFVDNYLVETRMHGTQMASLIIKGDLNVDEPSIDTPLYVRPIMKYDSRIGKEQVPENYLVVDIVHRAVKRMFDGEDNIPPTAPNVKIINFSIADPARVFYYSVSPLARLLDWLSYKYKILFIISAGNWPQEFSLDCSDTAFCNKPQMEREKYVIQQLLGNRAVNRIMSPSESINNITVGAAHFDYSSVMQYDRRYNPFRGLYPSTYTPFGGGVQRSIKPDFIYNGGRMFYYLPPIQQMLATYSRNTSAPGICTAFPGDGIDRRVHARGTSEATALITRWATYIYKYVTTLLDSNNVSQDYSHLFVKGLLTHGCSWEHLDSGFHEIIDDISNNDKRTAKKIKTQWIGYGYPDFSYAMSCSAQRVTVIGYGELLHEQGHQYTFPLPPSLSSRRVKRKLIVTLAWQTPISSSSQRYRVAHLWVNAPNRVASDKSDVADWRTVSRGTLQHEIFEGDRAFAFQDGDNIVVQVNCVSDATLIKEPIKYSLIVSLEVAEGIDLPIYQEVRDRLRIPVIVDNAE